MHNFSIFILINELFSISGNWMLIINSISVQKSNIQLEILIFIEIKWNVQIWVYVRTLLFSAKNNWILKINYRFIFDKNTCIFGIFRLKFLIILPLDLCNKNKCFLNFVFDSD